MMFHKGVDQILSLGAVRGHVVQSVFPSAVAADIGFLPRIELRVHKESVFEIVDAQLGGFFISYRAQVPGDFDPALVSGDDCGFQLGARDVHVRLERRHSLIGPILYQLPCIVRAGQVGHLEEETHCSFKIGAGDVKVRAGELARVDISLQVQIGIGLDASGGAHRRHACGKVKSRRRERHLRRQHRLLVLPLAIQIRPRDVKEMIVHADDAWHHGVSVEIKNRRSRGRGNVGAFLERRNLPALDDQILVFNRRRARTVNHAHMRQDDLRRVHSHELFCALGKFGSLRRHRKQEGQ